MDRSDDKDPLAPEITLARLDRALSRCVQPARGRRGWVEVRMGELPQALQAALASDVDPNSPLTPGGRVVLPRRTWQEQSRSLRAWARLALEDRQALLGAQRTPSPEELARAPYLDPWLMMQIGSLGPYLLGWGGVPSAGTGPQMGPSLVLALGPKETWARLSDGWVRLSPRRRRRSARAVPGAEEEKGETTVQVLDRAPTAEALSQLPGRLERLVDDLVLVPDERSEQE